MRELVREAIRGIFDAVAGHEGVADDEQRSGGGDARRVVVDVPVAQAIDRAPVAGHPALRGVSVVEAVGLDVKQPESRFEQGQKQDGGGEP